MAQTKSGKKLPDWTTVAEAAECWGYSEMSVRRLINDRRVVKRKARTIWLIDVQSIVDKWGDPLRELSPEFR
jgi:hypothetical protein